MSTEKKFFPKLYPLDRNLLRKWFIKYQVEDYIKGGFKKGKYTGDLNLIKDIDERLAKAQTYIKAMADGETLPDFQGMKNLRAESSIKENTNAIKCCVKYIEQKELEGIKKKTASLYTSRINLFELWLTSVGKIHLAIGGIDKDIATDFLKYLKYDKKFRGKTFNEYKCLLGSIWEEYADKINGHNPWRRIKGQRKFTQHFKKQPLKVQQIIKEKLPVFDEQLWMFSQCIYYCGFRPNSELRRLKVKHLQVRAGLFSVPEEIAKGYKARKINIYDKLLNQFIDKGWHLADPEYYLFSRNGEPGPDVLPEQYFTKLWDKFREAFGIDGSYKLYGNKHTGGRALTLQTDIFTTKEHFGHSNVSQTEQYVEDEENSVTDLKFVQKSFPEYGVVDFSNNMYVIGNQNISQKAAS